MWAKLIMHVRLSVTIDQQSSYIYVIFIHIFPANMLNQCYLSTTGSSIRIFHVWLQATNKQNFENETKDQQNFERLPPGMNWTHILRNVNRHYVDEQAT